MGALAIASLVLTVASTAATVLGEVQASNVAQSQDEYDAQVAANNAIIAQREADDARERGEIEEQQERNLTSLEIGDARASAASRGVLVDEGSAGDITADLAAVGELDALTIRANAEREALGFEQQAVDFETEAGLISSSSDAETTGSLISAGGSLVSGGAVVADKWYDFSN